MKWLGNPLSKLKTANGINWCHSKLHISHKAAKFMANLTSQLCSDLQLAVYLFSEDTEPFKDLNVFTIKL